MESLDSQQWLINGQDFVFAAVIPSPSSTSSSSNRMTLSADSFRMIYSQVYLVWRLPFMDLRVPVAHVGRGCSIADVFPSLRKSYQINNFKVGCLRYSRRVCVWDWLPTYFDIRSRRVQLAFGWSALASFDRCRDANFVLIDTLVLVMTDNLLCHSHSSIQQSNATESIICSSSTPVLLRQQPFKC